MWLLMNCESGAPMTLESDIAAMKLAMAFARCSGVNHSDTYITTVGKNPPSKKPSMKRRK
jgi:hypothetical protein